MRRIFLSRTEDSQRQECVDIASDLSLDELKRMAAQRLGLKRIDELYLSGEDVVVDISAVKEGESLYATRSRAARRTVAGDLFTEDEVHDEEMTVVMLGEGAVGKSALAVRMLRGIFVEQWDPTIEDEYEVSVSLDGRVTKLKILDTAGQSDYKSLRHGWMSEKDAFIYVFGCATTSAADGGVPPSPPAAPDALFEMLDDVHRTYAELHGASAEETRPPIALVGNKRDVADARAECRTISIEDGKARAAEYGAIGYYECSAKTGEDVFVAFHALIRHVRRIRAAAAGDHTGVEIESPNSAAAQRIEPCPCCVVQ
jgi:GTPase SAR1 family protein